MSLKANYATFQVKLQWLVTSADMVGRPDYVNRLQIRLLSVDTEFRRLEDAYQRIFELADTEKDVDKEILECSRADYVRAMDAYDSLMIINMARTGFESNEEAKADSGKVDSDVLLSRLPTLQLPKFSGELDQWIGFSNLFDSLVDSRSDLSSSQKLAYLMSCLYGEARGLIQHIRISDEGYQIARDHLMKRYQNVRRLADAHVDQIMKLPAVTPRLTGLRTRFLNPLLMSVNSLERLGFPIQSWSFLLLHIILGKLPTELKTRFEQKYGGETDAIPAFSRLT